MIRDQFLLDVLAELAVDGFAGGGGASTGIEHALGRHVDHALNHDARALGMHRINHPQTIHHCEDIFAINPRRLTAGRPVGLGWFSPDCKHFSKAKGGRPLSQKIRGLAYVIFRWAALRTRVIYMENVEEIQTWGPLRPDGQPDPRHRGRTFAAFVAALGGGVPADHPDLDEMVAVLADDAHQNSITREQLVRGFGYHVEWRELRACDYGAPTIRKRLFLIARCDARPIVWPAPTHFSPAELPAARQRIGRTARCWRTAAECIDWTIPVHSIFLSPAAARRVRCKRPLAQATLARIAKGVERYVLSAAQPFIVNLTHQGGQQRIESVAEPLRTITAAQRGEKAVVDATLAPFVNEHANASSARTMPADEPLRTICAGVKGGHFSLAAAHLVKLRGDAATHGQAPAITDPLHTVSAAGNHHGLVAAYLAQHNAGFNTNPGHAVDEPISTISARGSQQQVVTGALVAYYGNDQEGQAVTEPLRTVTTKERFGLVQAPAAFPLTEAQCLGARRVAQFLRAHGVQFAGEFATVAGYVIWDLGMRMLAARELFRAQGFPDTYVIDQAWLIHPQTGEIKVVKLTKTQQVRMCGNSVSPPVATALVAANSPELAAWQKGERRQYAARAGRTTTLIRP